MAKKAKGYVVDGETISRKTCYNALLEHYKDRISRSEHFGQ